MFPDMPHVHLFDEDPQLSDPTVHLRPPAAVGISFAADVLKRNKQLILTVCETVSSFTTSCIIGDERRDTLRAALIRLCLELRPVSGPCALVRVDPAPGFAALANDEELRRHKITIEVGRVKNANKSPVAEKCIAELGDELLRISPEGGSVSAVNLAIATANLDSRIRDRGLSAREMWYQRDQFTNRQLPISDLNLIELQHSSRIHNHAANEKSKTPRAQPSTVPVSTSVTLFALPRTVPNVAHAIRYLVTCQPSSIKPCPTPTRLPGGLRCLMDVSCLLVHVYYHWSFLVGQTLKKKKKTNKRNKVVTP